MFQVPNQCIPWPTTGIRRVSINSFGFGGSNTHVILEDALHYLKGRGLSGYHRTAVVPAPTATMKGLSVPNGALAMVPRETNGVANAGHGSQDSCSSEALTNGTLILSRTAQANGLAHEAKKPAASTYATHVISNTSPSKYHSLLVFSAFDERAARRTLEGYTSWYETNKVSSNHDTLHGLAYTLAVRRGHMRWRSFAIAGAFEDVLFPVKPVRIVSEPSLYWAFTGQGAQYVDMGWDLIGTYAVFEETLKKVDEVYKGLGCEWSIFGE
jgi:acyl transferase domain-containing protein